MTRFREAFPVLSVDDVGRAADDVDAAAERLRAAGAEEVLPPTDQDWGERLCTFRDAGGHLLHIGSRAEVSG